jgi:sulfotransferase family protein
MHHQGVDMGVKDTVNYEDPYFVKSVRQGYFDRDAVEKRISKRNIQNDIWGMKVPAAAFHTIEIERLVRNPIFIFIYRNPVSVARSVLSRTNVFERSPKGVSQALSHSAVFNRSMSNSITDLRSPVICIEYEMILNNTKAALQELFENLGQNIKRPELLVEYMSRPGYKNVETKKES